MNTKVDELEVLLKDLGAWQSGHFLLSSGLHSREYIQCQRLMQYPRHGMVFARALTEQLRKSGIEVRTVVGPALGAVHWEVLVAMALDEAQANKGAEPVKAVFAERPDGQFEIRRGVHLEPGEPVLVVEDVTTTGGSAKQVVELVKRLGAKPVAVGAIIDRSAGAATFTVPFISLIQLNLETYSPEDCPLCKDGLPIDKPGSKKK